MTNMTKRLALLALAMAIIAGAIACGANGSIGQVTATPTKTPKPTFTDTPIPTNTPIPTDTPTPTNTPIPPTNTPIVVTATPTETPSPTNTPVPPTATTKPTSKPTTKPAPTRTSPPPAPTNTPQPQYSWSGSVIWDPAYAPNCAGPGISNQSIIKDKSGNPINGAYVLLDCYGNKFVSHPSGRSGEYLPGHYDFSLGVQVPQAWTCTLQMSDVSGKPLAGTQVVTVNFDTNNCQPGGNGHQMAIVNWIKN